MARVRHVAYGSNTLFVLACIAECGPSGARSLDVRRALAAVNGKPWRPGLYCWYFNSGHGCLWWVGRGLCNGGVDAGLWERRSVGGRPRWFLTSAGLVRLMSQAAVHPDSRPRYDHPHTEGAHTVPKFDVTAACLKYAEENKSHGGRAFDIVLSKDVSLSDVMWSADRWEDGVPVVKMFGRNEELELELDAGTRLRGVTYRSYDEYPGKQMTDFYLNGLWYSARFTTPESLASGTYEALDGCGESVEEG